jgi:hypothetical protein
MLTIIVDNELQVLSNIYATDSLTYINALKIEYNLTETRMIKTKMGLFICLLIYLFLRRNILISMAV